MMQLNRGLSVWQKPKDFFHEILSFLWEGSRLNAWVSRCHTPRSSNKQLLYYVMENLKSWWPGTSSLLTCVKNWIHLLPDFTSKLSISITIHDATKSRIICLTKNWRTSSIKFSVSYEKDTKKKKKKKTPRPDN